MSKLSIRTIALVLCVGLISCSIENSSSAKLGEVAKKFQKNGNLIIDKAMSDTEGYERLGEMLDTFGCLLYTSPSPRDRTRSRMPSSA